eukprot:157932-Amphidinium_carterae.1
MPLTPEEARAEASRLETEQVAAVVKELVAEIAKKLGGLAVSMLKVCKLQQIISAPNTATWLRHYADGLDGGMSKEEAAKHATRLLDDDFGST